MRNLEQEASSFTPCSDWAQSTLDTLRQRSPTSLHVSLAAMRATLNKTRYGTFQREYELASHFMIQPDFVNGVTARLIKRDEPKWSLPPDALSQSPEWVTKNIIENGHFNEPVEQSFYMLSEGKRDLVTKERGLFAYSLPMEVSVLATLMRGKMDGSVDEDAKFTRKELAEYIIGENLSRAGAERKLNFILDRKTVEDEFGKLIWKFDHVPSK
jgi:3-hydroxyisobutyryl-CoA hydrolase